MAKVPFRCDDLDESSWPDECRDFTPSVRLEMSDGDYADFMALCDSLTGNEDAFRDAGCKRRAHYMVRGGRQRLRGKGEPTQEQQDVWVETLERQPPATPILRRTQSKAPRTKGKRAEQVALQLKRLIRMREIAGQPSTLFVPGEVPDDLLRIIDRYAIPRRRKAFIEIFRRYGLSFLPDRLPPLPDQARLLAFTQGLAVMGTQARVARGQDDVRFFNGGAELRGVLVDGKVNSRVVRRLNAALNALRVQNQPPIVVTLASFNVLFTVLQSLPQSRSGKPPMVEGFIFGDRRLMLPKRAATTMETFIGDGERPPAGLSAPELQHLIFDMSTDVKLKADMKKLRYVTPEALALWLSGDTLKRTKRKGRRSAPLQTPKVSENPMARRKKTRRNPSKKSGGFSRRSGGESIGIAKLASSSSSSPSQLSSTSTSLTTQGTSMVKQANVPSLAKPRVKPRRVKPGRRRALAPVAAPAFDPLAELIKEFTPQPKARRLYRRSPNLAKPTRFSDDPYAISKDPYGSRTSLPTNRRNPRRKKARSNPDAAAAMQLHHNTGMSLKQAWQCVKRGESPYDFGSQYEYRRGPYTAADAIPPVNRRNPKRKKTRKKARSNPAADAMELHHNEGISLKAAWKRVKRGDY